MPRPYQGSPTSSAYVYENITAPTGVLPKPFRALYVGAAGTVTITPETGPPVTFAGVPAGTKLEVIGIEVSAAPGNLVALYE